MLQAFIITLREGLEAFLIVAVTLAYLRNSGRGHLTPAVVSGTVAAILMSAYAATLYQAASNQALWEGVLALIAAAAVIALVVHIWRHARGRTAARARGAAAVRRAGAAALLGMFLFTLLMITRKSMETALLLGTLLFQLRTTEFIAGAIAGLMVSALIAFAWSHYGHRLHQSVFLQVTAVFLTLFTLQLLLVGVHELAKASVLPYSEALYAATEPYGPDGQYGEYLSYLLVALPVGWLVVAGLSGRKQPVDNRAA